MYKNAHDRPWIQGPMLRVIVLLFTVTAVFVVSIARGEIYQWQDQEGQVHFTDDLSKVPKDMRRRVQVLPQEAIPAGQPEEVAPEEEKLGTKEDISPSDEDASTGADLEEEKVRLEKKIQEDTEALEALSRAINRIYPIWKRAPLQKEKERLEKQIEEDRSRLDKITSRSGSVP